ncbi:MAG: hypothetical protein A2846_03195 [Candidatus Doudnabacteria bacterium RIFCSPHIGHO2_01_FULL_49_9]|uniref:Glycosyl transferase n=1 Tax=Candidatus Doudnabacteria bacterium RIFCSPHIGHO2_01_FULL_49_9 TaxID=1817827 RepID=A0A1F5NZ84_9BACT|nr:MAG: hypothetical protein A2846_03195 [Candidatus Doudnabacteria bacterium RIFCSPHIGHO2_01_FULL_49_9]
MNRIKGTHLYKELRYIYRSFLHYHRPFDYLYYRYVVGPKIRKLDHPIDREPTTDEYSVHTLCNHEGLDLMLWALASWYLVAEQSGPVYIHEDGTFTEQDRTLVKKLLPHATLIDRAWAQSQIDGWLSGYPAALDFRKHVERYIYMLKFIDPYFVSNSSARLVLDIDMLWFKKPDEVFDLLLQKKYPFMIRSYRPMEYKFTDGSSLPPNLQMANAGAIGYQTAQYELARLEEFLQRNGTDSPPRLTDQAGYAYILSASPGFCYLPSDQYTIKSKPDPVARHYTGPRREEFWFEGVKKIYKKVLG